MGWGLGWKTLILWEFTGKPDFKGVSQKTNTGGIA